jgi:hypothetical protein
MDLALETIRVLRRFKNVVLEGPPGTGKSHVVAAVAAAWERETGRQLAGGGFDSYAITLHPNTTYEEFIEGLRYDDEKQEFVRKDGFLREVIESASKNAGSDYLVLLDELNRANVPKVFGDLILPMEASKRRMWNESTGAWEGGMVVKLPYSGEPFWMPSNVYLLGTMNTTDRSIAPLDSALRRRFGFIRVEPLGGAALRMQIVHAENEEAAKRVDRSIDQLTNLNEALRQCLGPNAMLGHSYLFGVAPTEGSVADANDPLAPVREAASQAGINAVFWLEARMLDSEWNRNQLNLPSQVGARRGILNSFFPMSSAGIQTAQRSDNGVRDKVEIRFAGKRFIDNVVRYNPGGPNFKLYYDGETADGEKFSLIGKSGQFNEKVHVWLRHEDLTLELILLERTDATLAAFRSVSVPPEGWHESTPGAGGRSYGVVDLAALAASGSEARNPDADAEWMIWRYAILPQLIDTATQVGATDLLAKETRHAWLQAANAGDTADRWTKFDEFLNSLALAVTEEGYGLTRGLVVVDIPIGAAAQYTSPEVPDEDQDQDQDDDNGDQ